jgi:hypothetical protein
MIDITDTGIAKPMDSREEFSQQFCLLRTWLEAAPFTQYRGWRLRAFQEDNGWSWDIIEPESRGGGLFEAFQTYPSRSKALLEARRFVIRVNVAWEMGQVLQEFHEVRALEYEEYQALLSSLQDDTALRPRSEF